MKKADDVDTPAIAIVGIIGAILLFVIIVGILAWYRWYEAKELQTKVISQRYEQLAKAEADQLETLNSYRMVDPEKGIVSVPIDRAMQLVVQDIAASATQTQEGGHHDAQSKP